MLEELEDVNVARLRLSRDGLPSSRDAFPDLLLMMVDSFAPVIPNSGLSLVTLEENRLSSFVRGVDSFFSLQRGRLYDHSEDVMVGEVRPAAHRTADFYDLDCGRG